MKKISVFVFAFLAFSLSSLCQAAQDHVLVMTISEYLTKPLQGVVHDAKSGLEMAQRMGFDVSSAKVLKDSDLKERGLRDAVSSLPSRVNEGDRVFVYYSGHGASTNLGGKCIQSLVSQDEKLVPVDFLITHLDLLKKKTSEVFIFIDACHSGGLGGIGTVRSVGAAPADTEKLVAKVWEPKSGEVCSTAVNQAKSWLPAREATQVRGMAIPVDNFTFLAAANERELALDDPYRGGLATTSVLACLRDGVRDSDGSGAISAKELAACATEIVAKESPKLSSKYTAHTIEAYGNVGRAVSARPIKVSGLQGEANSAGKKVIAAFEQFSAGSNVNWAAEVFAPTRVKMGTGTPNCARGNNDPETTSCADIAYSTSSAGYLTILYVGSDGREIAAITPNSKPIRPSHRQFLGSIPIVDCAGKTCPGDNTFLFIFSPIALDQSSLVTKLRNSGKLDIEDVVLSELACIAHQSSGKRGALQMQSGGTCEQVQRQAGALQSNDGQAVASGYAAKVVRIVGY
jgi:hypothetical protein